MISALGRLVLRVTRDAGEVAMLLFESVASLRHRPYYVRNWLEQAMEIGNRSMPVVIVTAIFSGAVFALQTWEGFERFGATSLVAFAVARGMTRELIPVLAAIMVAGRAGSAMAAEIGTMKVTEQIDALETMATDPVKWLVVPRMIAAMVMLPALVAIGDLLGIIGGYMVSVYMLGARAHQYWEASFQYIEVSDVTGGLIKASLFGIMIAIFSCTRGFQTTGGAQGVGKATTGAVVSSSMAILISDFFFTKALLSIWQI